MSVFAQQRGAALCKMSLNPWDEETDQALQGHGGHSQQNTAHRPAVMMSTNTPHSTAASRAPEQRVRAERFISHMCPMPAGHVICCHCLTRYTLFYPLIIPLPLVLIPPFLSLTRSSLLPLSVHSAQWSCSMCTFQNSSDLPYCEMCSGTFGYLYYLSSSILLP